jgi:hypothetical protein
MPEGRGFTGHPIKGNIVMDQDQRITLAELKIEQHEKLHAETQESIRTLSFGVNELVQSAIRREHDDETFKRIFTELEKHRVELQDYKDQQLENELNAYKSLVWKVAGLAALVMASVVAGHFGAKLLG